MKNSQNAFKIVTAETQYLTVSKKVTQIYNYSETFSSKRNVFIISI